MIHPLSLNMTYYKCLRTELMHVGIPVIHCLLGLSTLHVAPPFYIHSVSDHEGEYHIFSF